jgi:hypothetical protein
MTAMSDGGDEVAAAALAGDERAFAAFTERHRRALHVHCYRMLASRSVIVLTVPSAMAPPQRAARSKNNKVWYVSLPYQTFP